MLVKRLPEDSELYHHGVKGQKWGVRRYQNPDGSLTAKGAERYNKYYNREVKRLQKRSEKRDKKWEPEREKLLKKAQKYSDKGKNKKAEKYLNKAEEIKRRSDASREITRKELEVLKNYKLSDFRKERNRVISEAGLHAIDLAMIDIGDFILPSKGHDKGAAVKTKTRLQYYEDMKLKGKAEVRSAKAEKKHDKWLNNIGDGDEHKHREKYEKQLEKDKRRYG